MTYNRRYIRDLRVTFESFFTNPLSFEMLGYHPKNKLRSLQNAYENPALLLPSKLKLEEDLKKEAKYASAAFSFITGNKTSRLKSYCLTAAVFMKDPARTDINIFYRSTEAIKKFGGDLCFLPDFFRRWIPPYYLEQVERVTFHFTLLYSVPIYYPLAYTWGIRVPERSDYYYHELCRYQLKRARDRNIKAKFAQTERVYRTFRQWEDENEK